MSQSLDLGELLRKMQEDLQGYVLDMARISQMGERQFIQFEKSVKRYFREQTDSAVQVLKEEANFTVSERPPHNV